MILSAAVPAKINLHLEVLGPRRDGFHDLWTLFQSIDITDELTVESADGEALSLAVEPEGSVETGSENLVLRAAKAIRDHIGSPRGARFRLRKRIPVAAGLGGGSADAAAALVLLDRLWDLRLPIDELERLAASVGSDVPFFLHGGLALGRGRGDRITPLPDLENLGVLVGIPDEQISTRDAFSMLTPRLTSCGPDATVDAFAAGPRDPSTGEPPWGKLVNDFEEVVTTTRPAIAGLLSTIRAAGPLHASISGSGSAVFGIFASRSSAREAARMMENGLSVFAGSTLKRRQASLWRDTFHWPEEDAP